MSSDSSSSYTSERDEGKSSTSLLSILDDKNKVISLLKDQLHNQQVQLRHYMHKKLNTTEMKKYSLTCLADAGDDNIGISMELVNFCRQNGIPTKLKNIYNNMFENEKKLRNLMRLQGKVLKMILSKIMETKVDDPTHNIMGSLETSPGQFSLFYSLFQINTALHKELRSLRIYCNKLIVVEDERNSIAEEVCALPPGEKFERKSLMLLNDEKSILESEVKELKLEKEILIQSMTHEPETPRAEQLNRMLENVNDEAADLVQSSLVQRQVCNDQLKKLKQENGMLRFKLKKLIAIVQSKEEFEAKLQHMEELCRSSVRENMVTQKNQRRKWKRDIGHIKKTLESVSQERDSYKRKLLRVRERVGSQLNEMYKAEIQKLKQERDEYKEKYECLVCLENRFNSMRQQNLTLKEMDATKNKKICELKQSYNNLMTQMKKQGEVSDFLQKQIKNLLIIIYILGKNVRGLPGEENAFLQGDHFDDGEKLDENEEFDKNQEEKDEDVEKPESLIEKLARSNLWAESIPLQETNVYAGFTSGQEPSKLSFRNDDEIISSKFSNRYKSTKSSPAIEKLQEIISQYGDFMKTTREVKSEPKGFEVDGTNYSNCERKHFNSETSTTLCSGNEISKAVVVQESDLMMDCSNESLQNFFQSNNKCAACTQISPTSEIILTRKKSEETCTLAVNADNSTNTNINEIGLNLIDRATSQENYVVDRAVSSCEYQKEIGTDISAQNSMRDLKNTPKVPVDDINASIRENFDLGQFSSLPGRSVQSTSSIGAENLPKTPLERLLEQETEIIPSHILQISQSDLVVKLRTMSSRLDETLSVCPPQQRNQEAGDRKSVV